MTKPASQGSCTCIQGFIQLKMLHSTPMLPSLASHPKTKKGESRHGSPHIIFLFYNSSFSSPFTAASIIPSTITLSTSLISIPAAAMQAYTISVAFFPCVHFLQAAQTCTSVPQPPRPSAPILLSCLSNQTRPHWGINSPTASTTVSEVSSTFFAVDIIPNRSTPRLIKNGNKRYMIPKHYSHNRNKYQNDQPCTHTSSTFLFSTSSGSVGNVCAILT